MPDLRIEATHECPEFPDLDSARYAHRTSAKALADALYASLPGGTLDHLLVELMTRMASVLRVPHPVPMPDAEECYGIMTEKDDSRGATGNPGGPIIWEGRPMTLEEARRVRDQKKGYGWCKVVRVYPVE